MGYPRILAVLLLVILTTAKESSGDVPGTITVQGRLTDSSGTPASPGARLFAFALFDDSVAGSRQWPSPGPAYELQIETNANGIWSAELGEFQPDLFRDSLLWLQIAVSESGLGDDWDTLPRVRLTSGPFALSARSTLRADTALLAENARRLGGELPDHYAAAVHEHDTLYLKTSGDTVRGDLLLDPDSDDVPELYLLGGSGEGRLELADSGGTIGARLGMYGGGLLALASRASGNEPATLRLTDTAGAPAILLQAAGTGNDDVQLPAGAIDSLEILDEPGIAHDVLLGTINLTADTMVDIQTIEITTPAAGYIRVEASCYAYLFGTTGQNQAIIQIDENPGGYQEAGHFVMVGFNAYLSDQNNFFPMSISRLYQKPAGTYTFRLEGRQNGPPDSGGVTRIVYPRTTATYYSTAYGSVATWVNARPPGTGAGDGTAPIQSTPSRREP
jgi:hypothetical protein